MEKATCFAFALLLAACHDEPTMTFGLDVRVHDGAQPAETTSEWCIAPGSASGETSGTSIDKWEIDEPPPHLFMDAEPDAEENVFRVRVYVASEREKGGIWWQPSEILAERVYDGQFAESGEHDSFVVDFEGEPYTVEVMGLPAAASCF
jgi:hypothetical protein